MIRSSFSPLSSRAARGGLGSIGGSATPLPGSASCVSARLGTNPVLWSHYADKHRGLCLGFDVKANDVQDVTYLDERCMLPESLRTTAQPGPLFLSKGKDWAYETECRRIVDLSEARQEGEHHFWPFGDDLLLREVVAGPRCGLSEGCLRRILGADFKDVHLTKARLGFRRFEVVPNRLGWARTQPGA